MTLRCLIVDDSPSYLRAASALLRREGAAVLGVASTTIGALQQTRELDPDVVLLDLELGGESGLDVARRLADEGHDTHVILVSTHDAADFGELIARSPAAGFVPKHALSTRAIEDVLAARGCR